MGQVVDLNGEHIMVLIDPMQGGIPFTSPGQKVRVHGEYQGVISTSGGGSYEAVMAEDMAILDQ